MTDKEREEWRRLLAETNLLLAESEREQERDRRRQRTFLTVLGVLFVMFIFCGLLYVHPTAPWASLP
jgi:hypothetical protein